MPTKDYLGAERRKYIRLDTVFPVQFCLLSLDGKSLLSDSIQGFTSNISKGGICLEVNNLNPESIKLIKNQRVKLSLAIEIPLARKPVNALAQVAWIKEAPLKPDRHLIGLIYEEIAPAGKARIMRYAWTKKLFVPVVLTVILILGLGFTVNSFINIKLIEGNKALVEQLVKIIQESTIARQKVKDIGSEREELQLRIQSLHSRIKTVEEEKQALDEKVKLEETKARQRVDDLNLTIDKLTQERASLQEQLIALQRKELTVTEELLRLDEKKAYLQKENLDKMYQWLVVHQNPRSGLVMSFEGDSDIANWAFIYDQALIIQAYTHFGDLERARKILDFFQKKAKKIDGKFVNAYYASDGNPAEYIIHSGPNIWLGIATLQYTNQTKDRTYLGLAEDIAQAIIRLQNEDTEGGIRGGPNVGWYATEHNLDAYAFFNMLHKITAKPPYQQARDKVLNWLVQHTYDKAELPIKRGKGDSTIATDTYAWSITAIGPKKLEELGMNPDKIMEFAENTCAVEVLYTRPEGKTVELKGFDFAPQQHLSRGGVVSSEWTAQMVMAFKIMADFYRKKGMADKTRAYEAKADEYLAELGKMIISSPSPTGQGESCLPYATEDFVDTGHGWMTPKGKSTGSVAGTAYTLFAYYKYNPLALAE